MKEQFDKIAATIYSVENLNHVSTCEVLIKQFKKRFLQKGHEHSFVLLGMLEAVKTLKLESK
jgi:hypothetical protein